MLREWIIFALCLGVGGHVALGVMLHAPNLWPWSTAGFYGLLSGLLIYAVVQGGRLVWRMARRTSVSPSDKSKADPFSW
ncbi:protein of unknown function [Nitrospira japonica]|uniref:Uncharacterized protein n=1 Tax=Nitrospira japonica TaxID=1325564 RepID=A0A1W1I3I7_9BACT|nr:hypothetical protein [Nitrospira japonica]SLM47554.1 protein of unknown function [Nitrospira japonica]